jgi:transcriptional regulator with XRE-family HTH domain
MEKPMTPTPVVAVVTYPALTGAVLVAKRKEMGLSQAEVAERVGLTVSTWSRIENGESALTIEQLAMAAQALGVVPSAILRSTEDKVAELSTRGIATSASRADMAAMVEAGAIPLVGASLVRMLGPVSWLAAGAVVGYSLYSRLTKKKEA